MNYINKGKRDVIIFPGFGNLGILEDIRKKYDELYKILPPHITLAFPFDSDMSDEQLEGSLRDVLKDFKPFKIKMKGVSFHEDTRVGTNYIFLDFIQGQDTITDMHNRIYEEVLKTGSDFEYIPHVTLGNTDEILDLHIEEEFETVIDEIVVERIGDNEESNIIISIKL